MFLICSVILTSAQSKKVVILDSIQSNKIITQLVSGDFAKAELKIYKQLDTVSQDRIQTLQSANNSLLKAFDEKQSEVDQFKIAVEKQEKIIKKEKNKKNFYKITTLAGIIGSVFLLAR